MGGERLHEILERLERELEELKRRTAVLEAMMRSTGSQETAKPLGGWR